MSFDSGLLVFWSSGLCFCLLLFFRQLFSWSRQELVDKPSHFLPNRDHLCQSTLLFKSPLANSGLPLAYVGSPDKKDEEIVDLTS